jgi:serine/threonine protein kinase/Flp pilus assembly protein TadD
MSPEIRSTASRDERLLDIVESYLAQHAAGAVESPEEVLARHPEFVTELTDFFRARAQVDGVVAPLREAIQAEPQTVEQAASMLHTHRELGDFRLIREVGRGGMGIVYEAEQLSLGRRVALKVLPFAATMDPRHLQRFKNEAHAAAQLHHTNIVPVHYVGCERGVHFYAMQFIEGQSLADVIAGLRKNDESRKSNDERMTNDEARKTAPYIPQGGVGTEVRHSTLGILSSLGIRDSSFFRTIAELGIQAAEALDYAHENGIIHRDIKPANLLIESADHSPLTTHHSPRLWITDFGLAQVQGDARITMTGDLVGTLRYMSPEQALAKRVVVDHRTDIYSLGATLYELLTHQSAYSATDRQELLRQIAFEEPRKPRKLNRSIPVELETIVLKAMEKNPVDRFGTAREMAADLRRWLEDRPIQARRPSWRQVAMKWARRHKPLVGAVATVLFLAALFGGAGLLWWTQKRTIAEAEARAAVREAQQFMDAEKWSEALSAARRAEGVLAGFGADQDLRRQAEQLAKDAEMALRLEDALVMGSELKQTVSQHGLLSAMGMFENRFDQEAGVNAFLEAFDWYGLNVESLEPNEVAERMRGSGIRMLLVRAMEYVGGVQGKVRVENWERCIAIARVADPDPWRNRLRDAFEQGQDADALGQLLDSVTGDELPPGTAMFMLDVAKGTKSYERALAISRRVQQRYPGDFWINESLGNGLNSSFVSKPNEAIPFLMAAVALRPQSPGAHFNLANALEKKVQIDEAIAEYREAIRHREDYGSARARLSLLLRENGQWDEAIKECHEAIRLCKVKAWFYYCLGLALNDKGQLDDSLAASREAIRLSPDSPLPHQSLGEALMSSGRIDQAIVEWREAIRLNRMLAETHPSLTDADKNGLKQSLAQSHAILGRALRKRGKVREAIAESQEAIQLAPNDPGLHIDLGTALQVNGQLDEAIAAFRESLRLKKDLPRAHSALGQALHAKNLLDDAIAELRRALDLWKDGKGDRFLDAHEREAILVTLINLSNVLAEKGYLEEALVEAHKAVELAKEDSRPHENLGIRLLNHGDVNDAITEFKEAIRIDKHSARAYFNLAAALREEGEFKQALDQVQRAHELRTKDPSDPFNSAAWRAKSAAFAKECEYLVQLESRLPAILKGQEKPKDSEESLTLARMCQLNKQLYAAATRFYTDTFISQPQLADNLQAGLRYDAACSAALAGCHQGKDADQTNDKERTRLRKQALDWLLADIAAWQKWFEKEPEKVRPILTERMQHWLKDTDFNGVRGPEAIAKLPESERADWAKLWQDVAALGKQAAGKK